MWILSALNLCGKFFGKHVNPVPSEKVLKGIFEVRYNPSDICTLRGATFMESLTAATTLHSSYELSGAVDKGLFTLQRQGCGGVWNCFKEHFQPPKVDSVDLVALSQDIDERLNLLTLALPSLGFKRKNNFGMVDVDITEGVISVGDSVKEHRVTGKPLFVSLNLAEKHLLLHEEVKLSAFGKGIATAITISEILKNAGLAVEKKVETSTANVNDDSSGQPIKKAKIVISLAKTEAFDGLMTAAAAE